MQVQLVDCQYLHLGPLSSGGVFLLELLWERLCCCQWISWVYHCMKSVCIGSFSGPYFLAFGLHTHQKTPNTDSFHAVYCNLIKHVINVKSSFVTVCAAAEPNSSTLSVDVCFNAKLQQLCEDVPPKKWQTFDGLNVHSQNFYFPDVKIVIFPTKES